MEPYGVFRRSAANPLFHPYFYDYAGDKQDFYSRMIAMNCDCEKEERQIDSISYLFVNDFGFNIPHKKTNTSMLFRRTWKTHPMLRQYWSFMSVYMGTKGGYKLSYMFVEQSYHFF